MSPTGRHRGRLTTRGLGAVVVVMLASLAGVASAGAATGSGIQTEQTAVVTADHQPAISAAAGQLAAARSDLAAATSRRARDQALAAEAAGQVSATTATVAADGLTLVAATSARNAATTHIGSDRSRLRAIGVELYVSPEVTPAAGPDAVQQADQQLFGTEVIKIGTDEIVTDLHRQRSAQTAAIRAVTLASRRLVADRATLLTLTALRDHRSAVLAGDGAAVTAAGLAVGTGQAVLAAADAALARAVAALANPVGAPDDGSPTIVGAAALTAEQLTTWFDSQGFSDLTTASVAQLAGWYISEGASEGVRGDLAFAQATVETGGFASPDAVNLSNYAGIGHCDSCGSGLAFGSPQLGVRGQIQLLHSFADASLTSTSLAEPLAAAALTPQTQPDKGCCRTWQSLTGRWATDPQYWTTILRVYQSMLASALQTMQP